MESVGRGKRDATGRSAAVLMPRFDLFHGKRGYLLDVQADLLEVLSTRIVVPLLPKNRVPNSVPFLNPVFMVAGYPLTMATHLLLAMPRFDLGTLQGSLADEADQITRALDMALQGF